MSAGAQSNSGTRRRRAAIALLGGLAIVLAGCGRAAPPLPPAPPPSPPPKGTDGFFGVNGQSLRPLAGGSEEDLLDHQLAAIERGGLAFVRAPFDWTQVEPSAPEHGRATYDFSAPDAWVAALARYHLSWYLQGIGVPTPGWAASPASADACSYRSAPRNARAFAPLMARMATRYGAGGSFWKAHPHLPYEPVRWFEIWNEPNFASFWCPKPQPGRFARLALASARAIHAADHRARVVLGGLAGFTHTGQRGDGYGHIGFPAFLRRMVAAAPRLRRQIDVVGVHAYEPNPKGVLGALGAYRGALAGVGLGGKPVSLNEVGWPTEGPGITVPEGRRARYLRELTRSIAAIGCGVDSLAPFAWTTPESSPDNPNDWFGIASPTTARLYPSGRAYLDAVRTLEQSPERRPRRHAGQPCGRKPRGS
jgi:hypothetical protein